MRNRYQSRPRAIITGSSSGIGAATAATLHERGYEVVGLDVQSPKTKSVDHHVAVDLADPDSIAAACSVLVDEYSILVNAAGIPQTDPDEKVFAVNFLGHRELIRHVYPRMSADGAIVNVASVAGFRWQQHLPELKNLLATTSITEGLEWLAAHDWDVSAYALSKEALLVTTLQLATAYVDSGVRANAVLPGPVETPLLPEFERSMGKQRIDETKVLVGRHGRAEEISGVISFLAGQGASWVNGQLISVDGGVSAGWALGSFEQPPQRVAPTA